MKWLLVYTMFNMTSYTVSDTGGTSGVIYLPSKDSCISVAKELHSQAKSIRDDIKFKSTCMEVR